MNPYTLSENFDTQRYNRLPEVDNADSSIRRGGKFDKVFSEMALIFRRYEVAERFGVALLHKHNDCPDSTWMIEYCGRAQNKPALVTKLSDKSPRQESACPTVWQFDDSAYHPLEFSTDLCAKQLYDGGPVSPFFLKDFASLLRNYSIYNYLGLAVVDRNLYRSAVDDEIAVEYSTYDRCNVVTLCSCSGLAYRTVETSWAFKGEDTQAESLCARYCRKSCVVILGQHGPSHGDLHTGHS